MKDQKTDGKDALSLLTDDHRKVDRAFAEFERLGEGDYDKKRKLADTICQELTVHTQIEEELFYPAFREAVKDAKPLVNEAVVEHRTAKDLIKDIKEMDSKDEMFDAKVKVLGEYVRHHVKEEEEEIFPELNKGQVDLDRLGKDIEARKQSLV